MNAQILSSLSKKGIVNIMNLAMDLYSIQTIPELAALFAGTIITYDTIQLHNNVLLDFFRIKAAI